MKQDMLIENENVRTATKDINTLLKRPRMELPGIGLIYGQTGLGKTRFAKKTCFSRGWIYYSILPSDNVKSFLIEMYKRVTMQIDGVASDINGPTYVIEKAIIAKLQMRTDIVIMLDEINLLFRTGVKAGMLETIRSIADNTPVTIIMVGEEDCKDRISKYNSHLMNRIGVFCQFKPFSFENYKTVIHGVADIRFEDAVIERLFVESRGDFRSAVTVVNALESSFRGKKEIITMSDLKG